MIGSKKKCFPANYIMDFSLAGLLWKWPYIEYLFFLRLKKLLFKNEDMLSLCILMHEIVQENIGREGIFTSKPIFSLNNSIEMLLTWAFLFFGPSQGFFSSHSPQIGTNPYILSLLSQKMGSKLISLRWPLLVLP